jgi:hypothetical protein
MSDEDEVPGWEMQQDNEARRWAEEQAAMNRCRRLTRELRDATNRFEREMTELSEQVRTNWRKLNGNHG